MNYNRDIVIKFMNHVENYFCNHYRIPYIPNTHRFIVDYNRTQSDVRFVIVHEAIHKLAQNNDLYKFVWNNAPEKSLTYLFEHLYPIMEKYSVLKEDVMFMLYEKDSPEKELEDELILYIDRYGTASCDQFKDIKY